MAHASEVTGVAVAATWAAVLCVLALAVICAFAVIGASAIVFAA